MSRKRALWLLALATLCVRFVVLLFPGPDLYEQGRVMAEELVRGVTAREVLHGPLMDLLQYQQPFWGGHVVVSIIAAPFLALFGTNLFALRLATMPFALLMSLSGFALLDRCAGRRAAWIGGLLLALPPPGFLLLASTLQGTHAECVGLGLGTVVLMLRAIERPSSLRTALFGFACGFDLWFGYPALFAPLLAGLLVLAMLRQLPRWTHVVAWIAGALIGAAPWLRLTFAEHPSTEIYGISGGTWFGLEHLVERASESLRLLVTQDLALSLWLPGSTAGSVGVVAFVLTIVLLAIWSWGASSIRLRAAALWRGRKHASTHPSVTPNPAANARANDATLVALVLLPMVPIALLLASKFELGPRDWLQNLRYLLPFWPALTFGIALGLTRFSPRTAMISTTALLVTLALALCGRLDRSAFGRDTHLEIAPVRTHARMVAWWNRRDPDVLERVVVRVQERDPAEQAVFLHAVGVWLRWFYVQAGRAHPPRPDEQAELLDVLRRVQARVDPLWRAFFEIEPGADVELGETLEQFRARHPASIESDVPR